MMINLFLRIEYSHSFFGYEFATTTAASGIATTTLPPRLADVAERDQALYRVHVRTQNLKP